jgi:acyl-CoA synthetase (AMP-forming)/AMP-acid ligase II
MTEVTEIPRDHNPFPATGVSRDARGVPHYDELPATVLDMLADHVDNRPNSEALVELGAGRLTYRQLWDRASRVAGGLRAAGLKPGDRVAVRYPAGINWVLAFWGTVMAGGVAVAVNTRSAQPEVEFVLSDSGAQVDLAADTPLPDGQPYVTEQLGRADIAALFYTSGTTGHPKGVPTTHEAFLTNTENGIRCLRQPRDIGQGLRTLISVPLFHVTGCNSQLLAAARVGGAAVIMPTLNLDELIATVPEERISLMVTARRSTRYCCGTRISLRQTFPASAGWAMAVRRSHPRWRARSKTPFRKQQCSTGTA